MTIRDRVTRDSEGIYHISSEDFASISSDFKCKFSEPYSSSEVAGKWGVFAGSLYEGGGTSLLVEGKHFVID